MSRIPRKEAPWRLVLSKALFTRDKIQRKSRSNMALAKASIAKSAFHTETQRYGHQSEKKCDVFIKAGIFSPRFAFLSYLLFGLCLLYHLSAHFDSRGQDGTGEVCYINSLQVTHLLGSYEKGNIFLFYDYL